VLPSIVSPIPQPSDSSLAGGYLRGAGVGGEDAWLEREIDKVLQRQEARKATNTKEGKRKKIDEIIEGKWGDEEEGEEIGEGSKRDNDGEEKGAASDAESVEKTERSDNDNTDDEEGEVPLSLLQPFRRPKIVKSDKKGIKGKEEKGKRGRGKEEEGRMEMEEGGEEGMGNWGRDGGGGNGNLHGREGVDRKGKEKESKHKGEVSKGRRKISIETRAENSIHRIKDGIEKKRKRKRDWGNIGGKKKDYEGEKEKEKEDEEEKEKEKGREKKKKKSNVVKCGICQQPHYTKDCPQYGEDDYL
jgi:hypothetical protein